VHAAEKDLARLLPALVKVWRALRRGGEGSGAGRSGGRQGGGRGGGHRSAGARGEPGALTRDELADVARGVAQLSQGLTRDRALAGGRYMDDPRLLGAYLLFYWPVSYLQARGVFSELPRPPGAVLDLGSGPAPVAFAALDAGASRAVAADRSQRALAAARALAAELGEPLGTAPWDPTRPAATSAAASGRAWDTITLGHVVNELFAGDAAAAAERRAGLLEEAARHLAPGGSLVVIEPALRETSRGLLAVRDLLVARGFAVRAPCMFQGACPALLRESDWCHAERPIDPPPLVAEIARAAGLRKEAVKMSYLALAPRGEGWAAPPAGRTFRIVSEPLPSKGRLRYMACGPEGRLGLALQEKHVTEANRAFERLLRGDVVALTEVEPRGDGLRLSERSEVRIVARAGARVAPGPGAAAPPAATAAEAPAPPAPPLSPSGGSP
jgi:ribosomal protein RSM22 (predicted rRNA methylase)